MIIVHVDRNRTDKNADAIVVRDGDDMPYWTRDFTIKCKCGSVVGHVVQRSEQDEYGASTRVEIGDDV